MNFSSSLVTLLQVHRYANRPSLPSTAHAETNHGEHLPLDDAPLITFVWPSMMITTFMLQYAMNISYLTMYSTIVLGIQTFEIVPRFKVSIKYGII